MTDYLQLRSFLNAEAARDGITARGVFNRIKRGRYPGLEFLRINKRVVLVRGDARYQPARKSNRA
jgi:hypothetical protein